METRKNKPQQRRPVQNSKIKKAVRRSKPNRTERKEKGRAVLVLIIIVVISIAVAGGFIAYRSGFDQLLFPHGTSVRNAAAEYIIKSNDEQAKLDGIIMKAKGYYTDYNTDKNKLSDSVKNLAVETATIEKEIRNIPCPEIMKNHQRIMEETAAVWSEYFGYAASYIKEKNNTDLNKMNDLQNKIAALIQEGRQELIGQMDKMGMKYTVNIDGSIVFTNK